jgi:AAA domain
MSPERDWMLQIASGEIKPDTEGSKAQLDAMLSTVDSWRDTDPQLFEALQAGNRLHPERVNGHRPSWELDINEDPADVEAFEAVMAEEEARYHPYAATRMSDVKPEKVKWMWPRRLPLGKLVTFVGDPDVGKSTVCVDLTARVTTGKPMPDELLASVPLCSVVWMSAEDGLADTLRPRLDAAGADSELVHHLDAVWESMDPDDPESEMVKVMPTIPKHLPALEALVVDTEAKLVIVDVLFAYLDGRYKASSDQDVRRALAPLAALAERTGACIILIAHIPKSQRSAGSAITATPGAMGIGGAARAGIVAAVDPDDETGNTRVFARTKGNLAAPWPSMAYELLCSTCGESKCEGNDHGPAIVNWTGESRHNGSDLLVARQTDDDKSALDEAVEWLEAVLHQPRLRSEIAKGARTEGISDITLKRAAKKLGVVSERDKGLQGAPEV